jgi:hypothetical protein
MASDALPFGRTQEGLEDRAHHFVYSREFNALVQRLRDKSCFARVGWARLARGAARRHLRRSLRGAPPSAAELPAEQGRAGKARLYALTRLVPAQWHFANFTERKPSIEELILDSDQTKHTPPLIFNQRIESLSFPTYDSTKISLTMADLALADPTERGNAISSVLAILTSKQKSRDKVPFISFLIEA